MSNIIRISIRRTTMDERDPFTDFCQMAGICNDADKQNIPMQILQLLQKYEHLNSTDLSKFTEMSRGSVLNHLENLIESGFVFKYGKDYYLRDKNFSAIVNLLEKDLLRTIERMKKYAKQIDSIMNSEI